MNREKRSTVVALAEALADRIGEVVPDGVDVSSLQTAVSVRFRAAEETIDIESIIDQAGDAESNIEAAALMVLNDVQDLITEATGTPWPHVAGARLVLPYPHAEVASGDLQLCFGEPEDPALALRPIELADLPDDE
jgi:hypothetical protein